MTPQKGTESSNALVRAFQGAIIKPFQESRGEIKHVVWPSRPEVIRLTIVVVVLSATLSLVLFTSDSIYTWLLLQLQDIVQRAM
ncbi:MAG: preprotein translocase subunit SecE [Chloroflexi bacterium]|nr:preprotein translocase subunit SecE [Chloroflexota bacterium]